MSVSVPVCCHFVFKRCQPDSEESQNGLTTPFIPFLSESPYGKECHQGDQGCANDVDAQSQLFCHAHAVLKDAAGHGTVHGLGVGHGIEHAVHGFSCIVVGGSIGIFPVEDGCLRVVSQLHIAARFDHLVGIHEDACVGIVSQDHALKVPFVPDDSGQQAVGAAGPGVSDAVESGHDGLAGTVGSGLHGIGAVSVGCKVA